MITSFDHHSVAYIV